VIHAGFYYPAGSLKAELCVRGRRLLYQFCREMGVPHRRTGKLVVAADAGDLGELQRLWEQGRTNGVEGLELIDARRLKALEPALVAEAALLSSESGIVDAHELIKALEGTATKSGALILYRSELQQATRTDHGFCLEIASPLGQERLVTSLLVNAAGLESDRVSLMASVPGYRLQWCKGDYFAVSDRRLAGQVRHLIYPVPRKNLVGLGIHLTMDLGGRLRAGPDAAYVGRDQDYSVDASKGPKFAAAIRRMFPALDPDALSPEMAGIRPKLQGPDQPWEDFIVREEVLPAPLRLINLIGIESPGLTACLAIAERVRRMVQGAA
jgi:L-2-hydroxyglutarate oxidase LhgO